MKTKLGGVVYALGRHAFRGLVQAHNTEAKVGLDASLKTVPMLKDLSDEQRARLVNAMDDLLFEEGEYIIETGDEADALFLIISGEVACTRGGEGDQKKELLRLGQGQFFGAPRWNRNRRSASFHRSAPPRFTLHHSTLHSPPLKLHPPPSTRPHSAPLHPSTPPPLHPSTLCPSHSNVTHPRHPRLTNHECNGRNECNDRLTPPGESAIAASAEDAVRLANVVCVTNTRVAKLMAQDFRRLLGSLADVMMHNFKRGVTQSVELFESLTPLEQDRHVPVTLEQDRNLPFTLEPDRVAFAPLPDRYPTVTRPLPDRYPTGT